MCNSYFPNNCLNETLTWRSVNVPFNNEIALILRASHHLLEFLEVNATIAVGVNVADHSPAVAKGALLAELAEHVVQLLRRYKAVLVDVVEIERVAELLRLVVSGVIAVEVRELLEIDVTVAVLVELLHYAFQFLLRRFGSERAKHVS